MFITTLFGTKRINSFLISTDCKALNKATIKNIHTQLHIYQLYDDLHDCFFIPISDIQIEILPNRRIYKNPVTK